MNSPFYQPARQNFSSSQNVQQPQGGFGGGNAFGGGFNGFGGFQPQSGGYGSFGGQGFGQGFNQGFGNFGGGYGGGFSPFQGGFGGFGGGFNPMFGGGFNPMFGGIGGLGFNPMMGPQFGMPMQGFMPQPQFQPQFNPQQQDVRDQQFLQQAQAAELAKTQPSNTDFYSPGSGMQMDMPPQQAIFGGIGGLGFNPMMGRNFGMPMDMRYRGGPEMSLQMRQQRGQDMLRAVDQVPLTPEQKYQQAQQFGNARTLYDMYGSGKTERYLGA